MNHATSPSSRSAAVAIAATLATAAALSACSGDMAAGDGNVGFGGAQDIGELRDIIERGAVPSSKTLDAGGFFAEHYVELPEATCGQPLCVHPMLARGRDWLTQEKKLTLQLAVKSTIDPATLPKRPLDLVIIVDRSGSMVEDGRMTKVKSGLRLLVEQLGAEDHLALVSFDSTSRIDVPLGATREQLRAAINALQPAGGTNIHDGLRMGLALAKEQLSIEERESRVILLSDGLATAGNTSSPAILGLADAFVEEGIGLSTIGVGRDFDTELMRGLAERGAGNFYFLEDAEAVNEVFTEEIALSMTPIATRLSIAVTAGAGLLIRDTTGHNAWTHDARQATLRLPAAFAVSRSGAPGQGRRGGGGALFIELADTSASGEETATVTFSYRVPGQAEPLTQTVVVSRVGEPAEGDPRPAVSHLAMLKHSAMYEMYRGLAAALERADGYSTCAVATLREVTASATPWNDIFNDEDIAADLELVAQLMSNLRSAGFSDGGGTLSQCLTNEESGYPYGDDYHEHNGFMCSSGGTAGGLAPLGLALLALVPLRRRRASARA
jgi:Ca-activated chloride channel homolog